MTIVTVTYRAKPGMRDKFVRALLDEHIAEETQKENGNLCYRFSLPLDSEDEVCLLEKWENADCLIPHGKQPKFKRLGELKALYIDDCEIKIFEATPAK